MNLPTDAVERAHDPVRAYVFGSFRIDLNSHQLLREGEVVPLTCKAYDTLLVLVRHRDRVVAKDELMALVWPKSFVSDDSLAQSISVLRRALGDHSNQPEFIATIPRRGYRFVASVQELGADGLPIAHAPADKTATDAAAPQGGTHDPATATTHTVVVAPATIAVPQRRLWQVAAAGVAVVGLLVAGGVLAPLLRRAPVAEAIQFTHYPPEGHRLASGGVLSPDGHYLAFVALDERTGKSQLWIRALDSTQPRALAGTEDALRPFWSPDSQSLAFFANYRLKRVSLDGDSPLTLATIGLNPTGGSWGEANQILFAVTRSGLFAVDASGGEVRTITEPDRSASEVQHVSPQFLPGGRRFLYVVTSSDPERAGTYVGTFDGDDKTRLLDTPAIHAAPGYLVFVRDRTLMAQRFNSSRLQLTGEPFVITGDVSPSATISASATGLLAFGGNMVPWRPTWFSRTGEKLGTIEAPSQLNNLRLTSDQRLLIADGGDQPQRAVWVVDLQRGAATQLGTGAGPSLSPDGVQVAFTSDRSTGIADVYVRSTTGNSEELLLRSNEPKSVTDWTRDGRYVLYVSRNPKTKADLWLMPRTGERTPRPYLQTGYNEIQGRVSPDGRWIAYASDESGSWEVYLQSFPTPGSKRTISVGGGAQPQWRSDGRELFYIGSDRRMMSVPIVPGEQIEVGRPVPLFRAPVPGTLVDILSQYCVTADGERFIISSVDESGRTPITVMVNWTTVSQQ